MKRLNIRDIVLINHHSLGGKERPGVVLQCNNKKIVIVPFFSKLEYSFIPLNGIYSPLQKKDKYGVTDGGAYRITSAIRVFHKGNVHQLHNIKKHAKMNKTSFEQIKNQYFDFQIMKKNYVRFLKIKKTCNFNDAFWRKGNFTKKQLNKFVGDLDKSLVYIR